MLVQASGRHHRPKDLQFPSEPAFSIPHRPSYFLSPNPSNLDSPNYPSDLPYDSERSSPSDQSATPSPYMTTVPPQNPPIRVHSSTPNQGQINRPSYNVPVSMPESYPVAGATWDYRNAYNFSPQVQHHSSPTFRTHRRLPSDSTIGSTGPDSPYTQTQGLAYPYIVDPDSTAGASQQIEAFNGAYSGFQYPKAASAPAQYGYENTFAPLFNDYNPSTYDAESLMANQAAMKQALAQQNGNLTTNGGSPLKRSFGREGSSVENHTSVPKLSRTVTDAYQDELMYRSQPAALSQTRPATANHGSMLSPYNTVFSERLQDANQARSVSPTGSVSRGKSPFRETSEYASDGFSAAASNPHSPATRLPKSAARMREEAKAVSDAIALAQHQPRNDDLVTPKTISPKEAFLDYHETAEAAKMPLFPQTSSHKRSKQPANHVKHETNTSFNSDITQYPVSTASQSVSNFAFMAPSAPHQAYPFIARRQSSIRSTSDQNPEFPAHLTSMESTKSESSQSDHRLYQGLPTSSQESQSSSSAILQRPINTTTDAGTYTCVGFNCSARYDTAAKLQKHRRDEHAASPRTPTTPYAPSAPNTPTSATFPNGSSSALNRNQQPGPHRCERINPSTGKPCNTVFSRSYDLTRHEDTIHNGRKQKVRCRLCTEEKTFSRNDALTRHMRVVHPDVDFPGKKARRGG